MNNADVDSFKLLFSFVWLAAVFSVFQIHGTKLQKLFGQHTDNILFEFSDGINFENHFSIQVRN